GVPPPLPTRRSSDRREPRRLPHNRRLHDAFYGVFEQNAAFFERCDVTGIRGQTWVGVDVHDDDLVAIDAEVDARVALEFEGVPADRKSTRLNSSHVK